MIIVNQEGTKLFNYDNIDSIWILKSGTYSIIADGDELGIYSTLERAKEVFQQIIDTYKNSYMIVQGNIGTYTLPRPVIHEMPKE